jgi:DivIVA domain-containing protein
MGDPPTSVTGLTTIGPMDLTPKRIEEVEFRGSIRGYDRNEVDDFLDRVAAGFGRLQNQLTEAIDRATRAEERAKQAEERLRAQPQPIAEPVMPAPVDPDLAADSAVQAAHRTLHLAQRTADAAVQEARDEAERLIADAQADVERLTADANAAADRLRREAAAEIEEKAEQARWRMAAEVDELEATRSRMLADIEILDGHLRAHGDQLRRTLEALQRGLDDPASLRFPAPEGLSNATSAPPAVAFVDPPTYEPAPSYDETSSYETATPYEAPAYEPAASYEPEVSYEPAPVYDQTVAYEQAAAGYEAVTSSYDDASSDPAASPVNWSQPVIEFAPTGERDDVDDLTFDEAPPSPPPSEFPPEPVVRVDGAPPRSYPDWLFTVDSTSGQTARPAYANAITDPTPAVRPDGESNGAARPTEAGNGDPGGEEEDQFLAELRTAMATDEDHRPNDDHAPWLPPATPPSSVQDSPPPPPRPPAPPADAEPERWRFDRGR